MIDPSTLIESLIKLAQTASDALLVLYEQHETLTVQTKADHSPLTRADLLANDILVTGLNQLTPDIPIISEESYFPKWEERKTWQTYWLLDPLDGTRPFITGSDEFTVNIALIHKHIPIFGLVAPPITQECYYAHNNAGAYKIEASGERKKLHVRPWQAGHTILLTSHGAKEIKIARNFKHLGDYTAKKMSSSWKFCLLAEGKADISPRFGDTSEWDTAAAHCILKEAGGDIFDLKGRPLRYNTKESLLNPHFIALGDVGALKERVFQSDALFGT
jgi:3'(2'), 5'-bisphosphate nucleotidase